MNKPNPEDKKARSFLQRLSNKIKVDFSVKRIKTFGDFLTVGLSKSDDEIRNVLHYQDHELNQPLTYAALKELLEDLRLALEVRIFLRDNPPGPDTETYDTAPIHTPTNEIEAGNQALILAPPPEANESDKDYGLPPSERESCFLFWFQKKYAKIALDKILIRKQYGQLVIARAGDGKTFILGAIAIRLIEMGFHVGKTIAPWPYLYITKASIIEQTRRVLENQFGIDCDNECMVTSYDQLRSTLGEMYLVERTIVEGGEEHLYWEWRTGMNPCVFFIDESQAAKNKNSAQSKIIRGISRIKSPNVFTIFSSATPFVTVAEAEYFVVNCRMDYKHMNELVGV